MAAMTIGTRVNERSAREADRLLALIDDMLRELRASAPRRPAALDDALDRDLGLDSLARAELAARIERTFGVRLPDNATATARTVRDLLAAIGTAAPAKRASAPAAPPPTRPPVVAGTPESAATMVAAFRWHLEQHPQREHVTLTDGDDVLATLTYADLWEAAEQVARGLAASEVGRGDTVALMLPTGADFFAAFLGALRLGAIPVPLYPPTRWADIEEHVRGRTAILVNCRARLLVTVPEAMFVGRVARASLPDLRGVVSPAQLRNAGAGGRLEDVKAASSADIAFLQYTSGSTGDPKGVLLTHANLLANIRAMGQAARATSYDRFLSWLPLYHDMGLIGAWLGSMYFAMPLVLMSPTAFLARPVRWLRGIQRFGATISAGPNFAYEIAATRIPDDELAGLDLSRWRLAFNGAEPVRAATLERFASRFARYGFDRRALTPVYGLAEAAVGLAFPPLRRGPRIDRIDAAALARSGAAVAADANASSALDVVACGFPLPGHEIRIVDDAGRELPERAEGRVEFRGPSATSGYFRNAAASERLVREGWLDTGDIGYIADGELFVTSRAKDLIKRGGHNVHPYDLEAAVGDLPGIRKGCVAVFGTLDRATGTERVIVVAETKATDAGARAALRDRIVALSTLHLDGPADDVVLVPAHTVLKTSSGKIRRAACRELYESRKLAAPRRAVWQQLARLWTTAVAARARRATREASRLLFGVRAWLVTAGLVLVALPPWLALPGLDARLVTARSLARTLLRGCGIPVTVRGADSLHERGARVLVANHASYLDACVLLAVLPAGTRFVAKREFASMPVVAWLMRRLGTHFVERVDAAGGVEDTRDILQAVQKGQSVVFFPEGTFSRAPGLAAFRLGAFAVASAAAVPIGPLVLRGTRSLLRERRWLPERQAVELEVLAPILGEGRDWSAAVRLRDAVRAEMLKHVGEPDLTR